MRRAVFGIVGAGWRAEFFLRAAKELPEFFKVSIVVERNPEKAKRLEQQWGVKVLPDLDALAKCREEVEFVVLCLSPDVMPVMLEKASGWGSMCSVRPLRWSMWTPLKNIITGSKNRPRFSLQSSIGCGRPIWQGWRSLDRGGSAV